MNNCWFLFSIVELCVVCCVYLLLDYSTQWWLVMGQRLFLFVIPPLNSVAFCYQIHWFLSSWALTVFEFSKKHGQRRALLAVKENNKNNIRQILLFTPAANPLQHHRWTTNSTNIGSSNNNNNNKLRHWRSHRGRRSQKQSSLTSFHSCGSSSTTN